MNSLNGRVCIVTGAGGGIGREHALLLAREGAKVVVNDVGAAQQVVDEIRAAGGEASASTESVTSWEGAQRLVAAAVEEFGDLHVVVNNAGIIRDRMLTSMEEDDFDAVLGVHLKGTFNVSRWAAVYWRDQAKGGEIRPRALINTSSEAGLYGNVGQTNYAAAKAGIAGMTLTHSLELKRYGVRVNAIAPFARTRMTQDLDGMAELFEKSSYEPSDISPLVAVLAGEKCEFTGKVFSVFGRSVGVYSPWSIVEEVRTEGTWDVDDLAAAVQQLPQKIRISRQSNLIAAEVRVADRTPVIAGIGLSDYPVAPHLDLAGHHALATQRALADSGVAKSDIDGYAAAGGDRPTSIDSPVNMAEYLGIDHRWFDGTMTGGSAFEFHLQHASAAIREGYCDTVLITYASNFLSKRGRTLGTGGAKGAGTPSVAGPAQYEDPFGNTLIGSYAMAAKRHMHEYGTTSEQLAEIAVAARMHAQHNPSARYRDPITVEDVVNSRLVADPLHKLDCCVTTDGGGAVIVTTAERARDLKKRPIPILGAAGASTHWNLAQMPDFTTTAAAKAGPEAFARAGVTPADIDVVQLYDSFTITALLLLEDLGFCKKGEGGPFAESGALRPGGSLPINTDGGALSWCHPGMRGIFLLIEAVRQLRGEAGATQVPDCELALACGSGGWLSYMGAVILGRG